MAADYIPPMRYKFLTPCYDFLCRIIGLGPKFRKSLVQMSNLAGKKELLDVGCGTGEMSIGYKEHYPELTVTGVDPDEDALQIAGHKSAGKNLDIRFIKGSGEKLPFPDKSFDIVTSTLVIHHLKTEKKMKAFKEMHRVLRQGGRLIVTDFGRPRTLLSRLFMWIPLYYEEGKDNYKGKIPTFIKAAGFTNITVRASPRKTIDVIEAVK